MRQPPPRPTALHRNRAADGRGRSPFGCLAARTWRRRGNDVAGLCRVGRPVGPPRCPAARRSDAKTVASASGLMDQPVRPNAIDGGRDLFDARPAARSHTSAARRPRGSESQYLVKALGPLRGPRAPGVRRGRRSRRAPTADHTFATMAVLNELLPLCSVLLWSRDHLPAQRAHGSARTRTASSMLPLPAVAVAVASLDYMSQLDWGGASPEDRARPRCGPRAPSRRAPRASGCRRRARSSCKSIGLRPVAERALSSFDLSRLRTSR